MNKKGFIQAYMMFIFFIVLMMVQLMQVRYTTVLQYSNTSRNAYYCEMYIFHNLVNQMELSSTEEIEPSEEPANQEISNNQTMQFKQCKITLEQRNNEVYAEYQSDDIQHGLIITIDEENKEIMDVEYEY